jgi:15-cis-phytoene synthase
MHEDEPPAGARGTGAPHGKRLGENSHGARAAGSDGALKGLTPARHLAWLYSTDAQKPVLAALLEIEREIASGLRPGMEHHVAHARLQWWSEEAERVAQGRPVHPLGRELVKARGVAAGAAGPAAEAAQVTGITGFVDTAVWDLASATFETRKELTAYCERWASAMFETAAGAPSPWKTLGAAVREIELLADAAREAHSGRVRIPLDELDRAGLEPNVFAKLPWPAPVATLLKDRHLALRATIATSVRGLAPEAQMASRGLLVWAALTWQLSVRAQRALPTVIPPRRYDALADGWQAWRAARRAASGKLRFD